MGAFLGKAAHYKCVDSGPEKRCDFFHAFLLHRSRALFRKVTQNDYRTKELYNMPISFDSIENAFLYVSMDRQYMNKAYLCKETGQIFYASEIGDSDELPDDIDDSDNMP
jgi:hypothetical protein